jgi:uncharacterized damage-inducible protein DinB
VPILQSMVTPFGLVCEVNYSRDRMKSLDASPASAGVPFGILLRYNEHETAHWREWLCKQPETVLQIPAGDPSKEMGTVRDLLFHILIVEWVYAKVLNGENWESEWQKFDRITLAGIFAVAAEAQPKLRAFAESASDAQLAQQYKITARSGQSVVGSGRKFLTHIVLHSTGHWAQIAMLLRKEGHATDWQHDFIFSDVIE